MGTATILGAEYPYVQMPDGKWWMAANLAWIPTSIPQYGNGSSWWGNGATDDGDGRYYNYANYPDHDVIAKALLAEGSTWRGPTYNDAMALSAALTAAVGAGNAGNALKATSEWPSGGGTDLYGFNAKPAGRGIAYYDWTWERKTDRLWIDVFKKPNGAGDVVHAMRIDDEAGTFEPYSNDDSATYPCRVSVRLISDVDPNPMALHVVHDGVWKQVSEQHQIDGGWVKSSKLFVPSSSAWVQS
jgi:uncharacterized protein (TIGR02145 family)